MGVCCAALIYSYAGDPAGAQRWLDRYAASSRGDADGFVPFTRGELLAGTDPEAALAWFDTSLARERADPADVHRQHRPGRPRRRC